jgi:hypothetical protein
MLATIRRHVRGRANDGRHWHTAHRDRLGRVPGRLGADQLRKAEVEDLDPPVSGHEQIGRLDVLVRQPALVRRGKTAGNLHRIINHGARRQRSLLHALAKRLAFEELGDDPRGPVVQLLVNGSRAISKAELQQRLWPSTFVEETNLAGLVAEIRRALRDSASSPTFIRTVYGFGYRFVGDVTTGMAATRSHASRAKLCVVWAKREMVLMEGANIIGREPDSTIQIDARGVSRHHARIVVAQDIAMLEDLGSKNGTLVNGRRISTAARLSDGDEINLGTVTLTFRIAPLPSPTETVPVPMPSA